jgi:hypothetical protein
MLNTIVSTWIILFCLISATIFPLGTYVLSMALFGLPHVLIEMRYIQSAFQQRLSVNLWQNIILLLATIVVLRCLNLGGLLGGNLSKSLELLTVIGLVISISPTLWQHSRSHGILAITIGIGIATGIYLSPATTLLGLAILHNLTPIGFMADRFTGKQRHWALGLSALVFGLIPILILTGLPQELTNLLPVNLNSSPIAAGQIQNHLGVYVPPQITGDFAQRLFSAAVFLQCMHYFVVLGWLSRWTKPTSWLNQSFFYRCVLALGTLIFISFCQSFTSTRSIYSLIAAVHAWIEIPILLLATTRKLSIPQAQQQQS